MSPTQLDCGTLTLAEKPPLWLVAHHIRDTLRLTPSKQFLTVINTGRGYAVITVLCDPWLVPDTTTLRLRPGQTETIAFSAALNDQYTGGQLTATLHLSIQHGPTLLVPVLATFVMQAPDGSHLATIDEVVAWCRQNWRAARIWFSNTHATDSLLNQFRRWGHAQTAALELLTRTYTSGEALDHMLRLLDPQGYGAEIAHITADPTTLVYHLRKKGFSWEECPTEHREVRLTNSGGRYTKISIDMPPWLQQGSAYCPRGLGPGEAETFYFKIHCANLRLRNQPVEFIRVSYGSGHVIKIPVQIQAPLWRKLWWYKAQRPIAITIICVLGFIGELNAVPLLFSPSAQHVGVWYPPYLGVSIVTGLACMLGLWRMKRWAAYLYLALLALNQALLSAIGAWQIVTLMFPAIVTFFILKHMDNMS